MSAKRFASIRSAASLHTALPGRGAMTADTTTSWPIRARAGPGAAQVDKAAMHIGVGAFIHRFGSSLNEHVHFHVCVVAGVFKAVASGTDADADLQSSPSSVIFHPAMAIDETVVIQVQATLRRRVLRAFVGRGLLESCDAKDMLGYQHSGL